MKYFKVYLLITLNLLLFSLTFSQEKPKEITVSDQWRSWTFYANSVHGVRSMNDGLHYTTITRNGSVLKFSYQTGTITDTIFNASVSGIYPNEYEFNADETKILFQTNYERIYRRSFTADYYVYHIKSKILKKVSKNGKQQIATFSPNADKIAFIRKNNMFIKDLMTDDEKQITFDGEYNRIINGIPDWVYEEEFEYNKAYEWSPEGKKIAYLKFDETNVKTFGMTMFAGESPKINNNTLYPEHRSFKYPKAGEDNSIISVHIYDLESGKTTTVDIGQETDIYVPRIRWINGINDLCLFRLNRLQNKLELLKADPENGNTEIMYTETNKYYIDETDFDRFEFTNDGKHFIMTSERDGYRHIYLHETSGEGVVQITSGNWDVTDYYGYDEENKTVYYQSAEESPIKRAVYRINDKGKKKIKLSEQSGTNQAQFSDNFAYYINYFSNSKTPTYVTLHNSDNKLVRILEDNKKIKSLIKEYGGANKEFFTFKTSEDVELNAWMIKPPDFDPQKKYPVIIDQYSGPGSQEVLDEWSFYYAWNHLLAQKGAIMISVDTRGTGGRGEEFRKQTYMQLGKYETVDLIETARYLKKLDYVNPKKIGIWGWSYGGFTTSLCLTKGADDFAAGIAVASITNWRYYDNIYTERFMRTPQENPGGYDNNSPIFYADQLKGDFLIVHGSADDNVHWQNTAEFVEALVQADKQFEQFIYTNRNHSIYGGNTRYHLYSKMLKFWKEHLLD